MRRHSGLQRQVLAAYRDCLRAVRTLAAPSRLPAAAYARGEFRRHSADVDRLDSLRIEHLLRQARKQIERATAAGTATIVGGDAGDLALARIVRATVR